MWIRCLKFKPPLNQAVIILFLRHLLGLTLTQLKKMGELRTDFVGLNVVEGVQLWSIDGKEEFNKFAPSDVGCTSSWLQGIKAESRSLALS